MALLLDWLGKRWEMSQIQVLKEETPCWQWSSTSHCLNLTPNQIKHQELPCADRSSCLVAVWSYHDLHSVGGGTKGKGEGRARRKGTRGAPTTDQSWPTARWFICKRFLWFHCFGWDAYKLRLKDFAFGTIWLGWILWAWEVVHFTCRRKRKEKKLLRKKR